MEKVLFCTATIEASRYNIMDACCISSEYVDLFLAHIVTCSPDLAKKKELTKTTVKIILTSVPFCSSIFLSC